MPAANPHSLSTAQQTAMEKVSWALDQIMLDLGLLGHPRATTLSRPYQDSVTINWDDRTWTGPITSAIRSLYIYQPRTREDLFACLDSDL